MAKFKFELEPVLRVRRRLEEEKQRRVAELPPLVTFAMATGQDPAYEYVALPFPSAVAV